MNEGHDESAGTNGAPDDTAQITFGGTFDEASGIGLDCCRGGGLSRLGGIAGRGFAFAFGRCSLAFQVSVAAFALLGFVVLLAHIRLYFLGLNRLFDAL